MGEVEDWRVLEGAAQAETGDGVHSSTQSSLAWPSFSIWPVTRSTHSS